MPWIQKEFSIAARNRGFHLVTSEIVSKLPELATVRCGLLHLFIKHTSASITLNENADPSVRVDMESHFNVIAPENARYYTHDTEGADDMPAHIKSSSRGFPLHPHHRRPPESRYLAGDLPLRTSRLWWEQKHRCHHHRRLETTPQTAEQHQAAFRHWRGYRFSSISLLRLPAPYSGTPQETCASVRCLHCNSPESGSSASRHSEPRERMP